MVRPRSGPKHEVRQVTFLDALVAGVVQGLAVVPGISRSGSTIAALLWRGVDKALTPRLSFLMYLVVSLGVTVLGAKDVLDADVELGPLLTMLGASFAVGYGALLLVFTVLKRGRFRSSPLTSGPSPPSRWHTWPSCVKTRARRRHRPRPGGPAAERKVR